MLSEMFYFRKLQHCPDVVHSEILESFTYNSIWSEWCIIHGVAEHVISNLDECAA